MTRGNSYSSSLRRLFHPSSRSVDDDLADLKESFCNSSIALVPSALTPSRAPSNSVIAATRALFFNRPVPLDFPSGWEKGPVTDWYNNQAAKGSTLIEKIQLRKDYQHPYYHEYIIVSTRSGHTYRIDRRPDPDTPFDTIMKIGCTAHDTIREVDSTSLKGLDSISCCVIELHWQGKETIDLLYVLSICFAIHGDKWADRYTLQRYNCYFLSWTIIAITMRKTSVCRAVFDTRKVQGERALEGAPRLELELVLELVPVRIRERAQAREQDLVWVRKRVREREQERERERREERRQGMAHERVWEREGELRLERKRKLQLQRELRMERELQRELKQELGQGQELVEESEWAREWAREWAHGLGQIPLVLGFRKNPALTKDVSSRHVVFVMISFLYDLIYSNIARRA